VYKQSNPNRLIQGIELPVFTLVSPLTLASYSKVLGVNYVNLSTDKPKTIDNLGSFLGFEKGTKVASVTFDPFAKALLPKNSSNSPLNFS